MEPVLTDRLVWLANGPSPYNDTLFNYLDEVLGVPLHVFYLGQDGGEHRALADGRSYAAQWTRGMTHDPQVLGAAKDRNTRLVVGGWQTILYLRTLIHAGRRAALWTDTPDLESRRPPMRRVLHNLATSTALRRPGAVMGTGREAVARLAQMGAPADRLVSFPYFTQVPSERTPLPSGEPLEVLSIGRLIPRKRFQDVIAVAQRMQDTTARFTIVGDGPERAALEHLVVKHGLNSVNLVGWQDAHEIQHALQRCHLLLHPAQWEPYGVVVLEAMALGRGVVASSGTMAGLDRIDPQRNGELYPTGDLNALERTLRQVSHDRSIADQWGRAAHATALEWDLPRAKVILESTLGPLS